MEQRPDSESDRERQHSPHTTSPDPPRFEDVPISIYTRPKLPLGATTGRTLTMVLALIILALLAFLFIQLVL